MARRKHYGGVDAKGCELSIKQSSDFSLIVTPATA